MKNEAMTVITKGTVIAGTSTTVLQQITESSLTAYIIGMLFAYIYAMNSRDFKFSIKEDIPVVAIGIFIVYFMSTAVPKFISSIDSLKSLDIVNEISNIVGVVIGTVILLVVKYWLTIRERVVKEKMDSAVSKKEWK